MREWRSVEVKADGPFGAILRSSQPDKPRLWVDEATDEPGGAYAIVPQMLARCPGEPPIVLGIQAWNLAMGRSGFIGGETRIERGLHIAKRILQLPRGWPGEEIGRRCGREIAGDSSEGSSSLEFGDCRQFLLAGGKAGIEFLIVGRAIEQRNERAVLIGRIGLKTQYMRRAGDRSYLQGLLLENFSRRLRLRQHIDPIPEQSGPCRLQRPPDPHAQRLVLPRQIGDEKQPGRA